MTLGDIPAGMHLCTSAGWNQLEEDWRFFLELPESGAYLASKGGRAIGTAAFVRYDRLAWIAMMLVDPAERRTGIGSRLLEQVLGALHDAPCVGLDATPSGEPLYRRSGLVNGYTLVRTKAKIEASRFRGLAGAARQINGGDLDAILARDLEVFGADRGLLLRSLLARAPECAWILRNRHDLRGYCFGRPGRLFHQLGPIVAEDRESACALAAACFAGLDGSLFAIDAPQLDDRWLAWLQSVGFGVERPFVRMFRSGHAHPGAPARQYAITGPEFA